MSRKKAARIVEFPASSHPPGFETGSDVELASALIDVIRQSFGPVVYSEGAFYAWRITHWGMLQDTELRRLVHTFNGAAITKGRKGEHLKLTKGRIDGALHEAAAMLDQPGFFSAPARGINCTSGLIRVDPEGIPSVEPHDPAHLFRYCLPSRYDVSDPWHLPEDSLLSRLLTGCFAGDPDAGDKIALLGEVAGAIALGIGTQLINPKCIVLLGETAENGKSQVLDALKGLLPPEAISSVTPQQMGHEQYRALLSGKLFNLSDELGMAAILSDAFKAIITGEAVTAKTVYRPPFTFKPVSQHIFATNRLPPFSDGMDRGVRRRLLPLVFNRTIPMHERIPDIGNRIATEEPGLLLAFSIDGAQRLLMQKAFTVPQSSRDALGLWFRTSDPVMAFLQDEDAVLVTGRYHDQVTSKDAYLAFQKWARSEGIPSVQVPPTDSLPLAQRKPGLEKSLSNGAEAPEPAFTASGSSVR